MTSIKQKLDNDNHITCQSLQANKKSIRFLLDSGSDLNLIKLSALKGDVMVYDNTIYQLKGITEHCINTLGSTNLDIQVGGDKRTVEFHVVQPSFPVPHEGIFRKPFIVGKEQL